MMISDAIFTPFDLWVANTIQELGGNKTQYLQGLQQQWALTSVVTRMESCQGVSDIYFHGESLISMRDNQLGTTNKRWLH